METVSEGGSQRMAGAVTAIVTNIQDPEGKGRVKLAYPWLSKEVESGWARVLAPVAGPDRGLFLMPEVKDQVLVVFENGDINHPFVIGGLWNDRDKAPASISEGKNNLRVLKSRSGHTLTLDDTQDKEKLVLESKSGHRITLDDAGGGEKLTVSDRSGKHQIVLESSGALTVTSGQDLKIEASGTIMMAGGGQGAARVNDLVKSSAAEDPPFWLWVKTLMTWLGTHTHTGNLGAPTSPPMVPFPGQAPSECKGKIVQGSGKVKIGG